jgi:hypothetical protein
MEKIDVPALQAKKLPRCKWGDFLKLKKGELTPEDIAAMDAYLQAFVPPSDERGCVNCGKAQNGLFGHFTYDLAHGEGYCVNCGYPARANHAFGPFESLVFILQYHPDELKLVRKGEA